jgi:DNA-binding CsgD family transcriptional regulator
VLLLADMVPMLAPDLTQARPSQMCHPAIEDAKKLVGPSDRSGIGVVLINAAGEITVCNQRAEAIVRQADGLSVMKARLCAASCTEAEALDQLIADAVADRTNQCAPGGVAIVHRPSLRQPFVLIVSRLTGTTERADDTSHPRAVVLIKDPSEADGAKPGLLIDLFGLTRREAEVAAAVVAGHGLQAAAQQLGIALTTARTHLQHVFEKTHTRRQSELTSLVLQILAFRWP